MENTNKLKEITDKYYKDVQSIAKAKTFGDVDEMERKCVDCLQALQIMVGEASRDLYAVVQSRRAELRDEAYKPAKEIVEKPVEKPAKKAKKTRGKNNK